LPFDVHYTIPRRRVYDWQRRYEALSVCRNCKLSTVFVIAQNVKADDRFVAQHDPPATIHGSLNPYFEIEGFICVKDIGAIAPPEFVPEPVANAFREGATSVVTNGPNAAGAMFRLAIDLSTRPLLPPEDAPEPNRKTRRDLGLRLPWLFAN
jgi:hypothetical protein